MPRESATVTAAGTDRRVFRYAKRLGSVKLESFPYERITMFETGKRLAGHYFTVRVPWSSADLISSTAGDASAFDRTVRSRMNTISSSPAGPTPNAPASPASSVVDQLAKLANLLERGLITRAGYDQQKSQLLK